MNRDDGLNPEPTTAEVYAAELKKYESGTKAFLIAGIICIVVGIFSLKGLIGGGVVLLFMSYMWSRKAKELRESSTPMDPPTSE